MAAGIWYEGLGLMSGSSLDGLDLAWCRFRLDAGAGSLVEDWECLEADTVPFPDAWTERLRALPEAGARELAQAHADFGTWLGARCRDFMDRHACKLQFIASHGHTIFHWPDQGVSLQLGSGAHIAAAAGLPVVCDLRTSDVALGGQGAPFAPLADRYLFPGYDYYLNVGGIANISFQREGRWTGFDLGPANQVFNALAHERGLAYDAGGQLAARGQLHHALLEKLQALPYYAAPPPKSLDNGWVREKVLPLFADRSVPLEDRLHTAVEHLALQTAAAVQAPALNARMLASGGGANNDYLLNRMAYHLGRRGFEVEIIVPDPRVTGFKEAILIALMGALRLAGLPNCMREVTGAQKDAIGGAVYL
jgi:anhydro-N-acetylmuramic acid kinase